MPLKGVQITASSAKFAWLARHRKSEILGNNGDICLRLMGRFILGKINMSLGVLKKLLFRSIFEAAASTAADLA